MSLEPSIADLVMSSESRFASPDWSAYRTCIICRAAAGEPCVSRYGRVVNGRTEGGPRVLQVAHGHRKRRHGR